MPKGKVNPVSFREERFFNDNTENRTSHTSTLTAKDLGKCSLAVFSGRRGERFLPTPFTAS